MAQRSADFPSQPVSVKFYGNTAMPFRLHVGYLLSMTEQV